MSALLQKNNRKLKETITVKKAMKSTMVFAVLATIVFTNFIQDNGKRCAAVTGYHGRNDQLSFCHALYSCGGFQSYYAQSGKSVSKMVSAEKVGKKIIPEATCKAMEK